MNLGKAIKNLVKLRDGCGPEMQKYIAACNLGIEAMKRFKAHSPYPHEYLGGTLPGETKE